jgi:glycosyltransferase involved in cell wall biosynthesis
MKISIITPNFNYDKFIGQTIESVVAQDYDNIEHIIIDDGSTDSSVEVVKSFKEKYPGKIKLIQQENEGQTPAINVGLKAAVGDIICWINSDDTYCSNVFAEVVKIFKDDKTIDIIFGDANVIDLNNNFIYRLRHFSFSYYESVFVGFNNTLTSNAVFWRREITSNVGLMKGSLKCNMDGEYFSRITFKKKLYYLKKPLANFRKQIKTIAAAKHHDWDILINKEREQTQKTAYHRLNISKFLPYRYSFLLKYFMIGYRALRRIIFLHYLKKRLEILRYKKLNS